MQPPVPACLYVPGAHLLVHTALFTGPQPAQYSPSRADSSHFSQADCPFALWYLPAAQVWHLWRGWCFCIV